MDVALIRVKSELIRFSAALAPNTPTVNDPVFALGAPNKTRSVSAGTVIFPTPSREVQAKFDAYEADADNQTWSMATTRTTILGAGPQNGFIVSTNRVYPGNSGGPLFNANGQIAGIVLGFSQDLSRHGPNIQQLTGVDLAVFNQPDRISISASVSDIHRIFGAYLS